MSRQKHSNPHPPPTRITPLLLDAVQTQKRLRELIDEIEKSVLGTRRDPECSVYETISTLVMELAFEDESDETIDKKARILLTSGLKR